MQTLYFVIKALLCLLGYAIALISLHKDTKQTIKAKRRTSTSGKSRIESTQVLTKWGKLARLGIYIVCPLALIGLYIEWQKDLDDAKKKNVTEAFYQAETNYNAHILKELANMQNSFSTNTLFPAQYRLAIFDKAISENEQDETRLRQLRELSDSGSFDLNTLRNERETELALKEDTRRKADLEQAKQRIQAEIQSQQKAEQEQTARQSAIERQRIHDARLLRFERHVTSGEIIPIVDFAIRCLDKMVTEVANQSKQRRFSDFSGTTQSVYSSSFLQNGLFVDGTNTLSVGTNDAWNFRITTHAATLQAKMPVPDTDDLPFGSNSVLVVHVHEEPYAQLNISCHTTNGDSTLNLMLSSHDWNTGMMGEFVDSQDINSNYLSEIKIHVAVPNTDLNFDKLSQTSNYSNMITAAIRQLYKAQDLQCPIN